MGLKSRWNYWGRRGRSRTLGWGEWVHRAGERTRPLPRKMNFRFKWRVLVNSDLAVVFKHEEQFALVSATQNSGGLTHCIVRLVLSAKSSCVVRSG